MRIVTIEKNYRHNIVIMVPLELGCFS